MTSCAPTRTGGSGVSQPRKELFGCSGTTVRKSPHSHTDRITKAIESAKSIALSTITAYRDTLNKAPKLVHTPKPRNDQLRVEQRRQRQDVRPPYPHSSDSSRTRRLRAARCVPSIDSEGCGQGIGFAYVLQPTTQTLPPQAFLQPPTPQSQKPYPAVLGEHVRVCGVGANVHWTDNENRAEEVSKLKDEHVQKQKEGKGHWEEGLASESESAVRLQYTDG